MGFENLSFAFFFNSILLGVGLAMDAFSVSLANGLHDPKMKRRKMIGIAAIFALFQTAMPFIGWGCVCTVSAGFKAFEMYIPWIALALLGFIGGKMLYEGIKNPEGEGESGAVGFSALLVQGVATSIDALSVGFTVIIPRHKPTRPHLQIRIPFGSIGRTPSFPRFRDSPPRAEDGRS